MGDMRRNRWRIATAVAAALAAGTLLAGNVGTAEAVPPEVVSRWDDDVLHTNSIGASTVLGLPSAGPYTITAKLSAENLGATSIQNYACQLSAEQGADTDSTSVTLAPNSRQAMVVHVVHNFTGNRQFVFACTKPAGSPQVRITQLKITAIKVNALDNQPIAVG